MGGQQTTILDDLQGLRALAVCLVLIFHLFPETLTGGYVGVDVFFVLSGYLMTALLMRENDKSGKISFSGFYARRIRRLVPAASIVVAAVALFAFVMPETRWMFMAQEIIASTFFVENWLLAWRSVDYLSRDAEPGMLQHYWTLGVEFQFYIIWPFIVAASIWLSRRTGLSLLPTLTVAAILVTLISLAASVYATPLNPDRAYFATELRIWEFSIGGIVAASRIRDWLPGWLKAAAGLLGVAMIVAASVLYSKLTLFPGWAALVPCGGAALFIAAGGSQLSIINRAMSFRPITYIGDISYSIYLWHWPLIIVAMAVFADQYDWPIKLGIAGLSVLLAIVTKIAVEDPLRRVKSLSTTYFAGSAFAATGAALACIPLVLLVNATSSSTAATSPIQGANFQYPGARALISDTNDAAFIPGLAQARRDRPVANADGCHVQLDARDAVSCTYGDPEGSWHIVLIGDSHAGQLSDAFKLVAESNGWRYTHMSKSNCPFLDAEVTQAREQRPFDECTDWNEAALATILELQPDMVFTTQIWRIAVPDKTVPQSFDPMAEALVRRWETLRAHGIEVAAIRDTPDFGIIAADCEATTPGQCDQPRAELLHDQPLLRAAEQTGVPVLDLTDAICTETTCPTVVGNVFVWRDQNHMTATYVRTIAPFLEQEIRTKVLERTNSRTSAAN